MQNPLPGFAFTGLGTMRKASGEGTRADKESEQLAQRRRLLCRAGRRRGQKKGFPTKQQPPPPQISSRKVSGLLRGARALMYHLLGASWHVLLPAAHWGKIAVTQI